jgi:pyridoxal phosphate enzyme (YggS family)
MVEERLLSSRHDRICQNVQALRARIATAAQRSGRNPQEVTLVAVTKTAQVELVRPLVASGVLDLGENYPQELWRKAEALAELAQPVRWHLIGHLQTNKARKTLPLVVMIHAVDSLRLLQRLDTLARELSCAPPVCLQVNTSEEVAKHGWSPAGIFEDAEGIASCGSIPVVGLMTMAAWGTDAETARPSFVRLRQTRDTLRERTGLPLLDLSMGMSGDFESAVEEGATVVRIGSALFEGVEP